LVALSLTAPAAQERPLPEYGTFAAEVKARLAMDRERQSGYMFIERQTEQRLDSSGRVTDETVRVFEVYPGLPGENRYRRMIEEAGRPVSPDTLAHQDRERQKEADAYARRLSTRAEQLKLTQQREKERQRFRAAVDDLFRIYDIRLIRREAIDGHDTILATLTPRKNVKPETDDGDMMRHFKARAWVSESDYELVRAEIEAIEDLSFGWGLLARVHKGTVATYQRRKVNDEVWLPARVTWTASARVLLFRRLRQRAIHEYSGYRKFTVDTSTTYGAALSGTP
jgi:hypothetical protein